MKPTFRGVVASSQDSEKVANTVKGIVLTFSSVIVLITAQTFHVTLTAQDMVTLATDIGAASGAIWTIYGLAMKLVVFLGRQ